MREQSAVDIRDVSVSFGSVQVLKTLNLSIAPGEFIVLLGPSGCGKSTLLNAIAGLLDVRDGSIHIGGRNVTWEEPKDRGIAMVFQSYALYPRMTVRKNMSFGLTVSGAPRAEVEARVAEAAQMLRLTPLLERRPAELSGGQRQRVAIGRALVKKAGVYLFDEPLSNLDAQLRAELRVEIKRLHGRLGATMIYVTHDQIEALTLADRIAVMEHGVIQQLDAPATIYRRPMNRFVASFVGSPAMNFLPGRIDGPMFAGGGARIGLAGYGFARGPRDGEAVLGVRPEHVRIVDAAGAIRVKVEMVEPMGADMLIWSRLPDGAALSIRGSAEARVAAGDELPVVLPPDALSLFDTTPAGNRI
jgi:multiple sugar transport system ATP-binding protein